MPDLLALTRDVYRAYETGDRGLIDGLIAEDFTFSAPPDVGIDRTAYFERCWPNAGHIDAYDFVRLTALDGGEVLVTYEATRTDGTRFRNTEVLTFAGEQLVAAEVYWGWDLD